MFVKCTNKEIVFRNLKDGQTWEFQKLNDTASNAYVDGFQVVFGLPKVSQVIYPQQTIRLNSGWKINALPDNTMMHVYPSNAVMESDLIAIPQSVDSSKSGGELVQVLMNNSQYPIQISLTEDNTPEIHQLDPNTLVKSLKLDFGELLKAGLGVAEHLLPFFV